MQSLKIRGRKISLSILGDGKIEYLLAGASPEFIEEITAAVNQTSYVIEEETETNGNRVTFKHNVDDYRPLNELRQRVANVIVTHMEHAEKRKVKKRKTSRGHKGSRSYTHRPLTT